MDQEFTHVAKMVIESELSIEIIHDALVNMQEHPYASPKLALELALLDWEK